MLLWIDGFEGYGASVGTPAAGLSRRYGAIGYESSIKVCAGRFGGSGIKLEGASVYLTTPALTTNDTLVVGVAFKVESIPLSSLPILSLWDDATQGMSIYLQSTGQLQVRLGPTTVKATTDQTIVAGSWYWLEFKVTCAEAPSGSFELRIGGSAWVWGTSTDTRAGTSHNYHNAVRLGTSFPNYTSFDDLYILDGLTPHFTFLGNRKVVAIHPNGDDGTNEWTPKTAGDHFEMVDETVADDEASYVDSNLSGKVERWDYQSPSGLGAVIDGIQVNTDVRETDAISYSLKTLVNGQEDTAQTVGSTSYITKRRICDTDPVDAGAWTSTKLNSADFGIKVG